MPDLTTFFGPTHRRVTRSGERRTVSITRPYAATPAALWSACTDPDRVARWLGEVTGDRTPGGELRLTMSPPDQDVAVLRVESCDEPHRLSVGWSWPGEPDSRVELTLEADGDSTLLTLEHSLLTEATAVQYGFGWEDFLNRLHELIAGREPSVVAWSEAQEFLEPVWRAAAKKLLN
jgi:uncharacterized protein YndB with AHSA1/START domain